MSSKKNSIFRRMKDLHGGRYVTLGCKLGRCMKKFENHCYTRTKRKRNI